MSVLQCSNNPTLQTSTPVTHPLVRQETEVERPCLVIIHNDDTTPFEFVIYVLLQVFELSMELAEHVTWEAHHKGLAPVVSRPCAEAVELTARAHGLARAQGFPLEFTVERNQSP